MDNTTEIVLTNINHDVSLPFILNLEGETDDRTRIKCTELLRLIPGKRLVCRALWKGQTVVTKVLMGHARSKNSMSKEKAGAKALRDKGITTPELLYAGVLEQDDAGILIYENIANTISAHEAWKNATTENKITLLRDFMVLLAQHHDAGLSQQDMHLSNFIIANDKLYTLDAADILVVSSPLDKRAAIENLASFFSLFHKSYNHLIAVAYDEYNNLRTWPQRDGAIEELKLRVEALRQLKKKKYLKKIFRECSEFICNKSFRKYIVYDRCYDSELFRKIIKNPDNCFSLKDRNIIKQGNTCTISTFNIDHKTFVIKRYNTGGFITACKHAFGKTPAMKSWVNAHRLLINDIRSARPVALIENRFGPVRGKAYFIMQHITGMNCVDYFSSDNIKMDDKKILADKIAMLFEKLASHHLSHGNAKANNIIICNGQPVLLDLDNIREHNSDASLKKAIMKDIEKFLKNWEGSEILSKVFRHSLDKLTREMQLPVI